YAYDPWTGQTTSIISKNDSDVTLSEFDYVYDLAGQLTSKTEYQPELDIDPVTTLYDYDDQGQLTQDGSTGYAYDPNGNRTDAMGYTTGSANALLSDGTWSYKYDAEGNRIEKEAVSGAEKWTYGYDHLNNLVEVDRKSNGTDIDLRVQYTYDVWGNRIGKSVDADGDGTTDSPVSTKFALDGWNPAKSSPVGLENYDVWADIAPDGSLKTHYVRDDKVDGLFSRIDYVGGSGTPAWYLTDSLGSMRDVVNSSGAVIDAIRYDAFGGMTQSNAASLGRYAWTGREVEVEIAMQLNRARFYDATVGRWISNDPTGFKAGDSNLYRYVNNAPTNRADPSGLQAPDFQSQAINGVDKVKTVDLAGPEGTDWFALDIAGQIELRSKLLKNLPRLTADTFYLERQAPFLMAPKWLDFRSPEKGRGVNTVVIEGVPLRKNILGNIEFGLISSLYPFKGWTGDRMISQAYTAAIVGRYNPDHPHSVNMGAFRGLKRADNLAAFGVGEALGREIEKLDSFKTKGYPTQEEVREALDTVFQRANLEQAAGRYSKLVGPNETLTTKTLTFIEYYGGFNTESLLIDKGKIFPADNTQKTQSAYYFINTLKKEYDAQRRQQGLAALNDGDFGLPLPNGNFFLEVKGWYTPDPYSAGLLRWLQTNRENYSHPKGYNE
ncbi:MAG: hypothetical protein K8T89_26550, partial [Planctomycetes bacterium]|nr:hypothetical protein [Planctomycetota bacterium]